MKSEADEEEKSINFTNWKTSKKKKNKVEET